MTMMSFRVDDGVATETDRWAARLGIDRSELLRDALRRRILALASERDASTWADHPLDGGERSLAHVADWGPAEEWSDWRDAAG